MNVLSVLATVYAGVLVAELLGDKTLYTIGTLTVRYRARDVAVGALAAFALKMLAAVLFGRVIHQLPRGPIAVASAVTFIGMAVVLGRKRPAALVEAEPSIVPADGPARRSAILATFAALASSEWGDPGQLTAATLVARHGAPFLVFVAAIAAMATKGSLALLLGARLRRAVPHRIARVASIVVCLTLAALSLAGVD